MGHLGDLLRRWRVGIVVEEVGRSAGRRALRALQGGWGVRLVNKFHLSRLRSDGLCLTLAWSSESELAPESAACELPGLGGAQGERCKV